VFIKRSLGLQVFRLLN